MLYGQHRRPARTKIPSRFNPSAVRSMYTDRGQSIRKFRQLDARNPTETARRNLTSQDAPHPQPGDTNGERYSQALDRLTRFKKRHKRRVSKDRRKAEWQEEHANLQRASQELTKAIKDILAAASTKKCGAIAPAWGGPSFPRAGDGDTDNFSHHDQSGRHQEKRDPQADPAPGGNSAEGKKSEPPPQSSKELADFELERQELERARSEDLQTDCSHVQQLRALVAEFVHGTRKPRTRRLLSGSAAHPDHRDPLPPQDRDDPVHFSNVAREDPMVPKTGNSVGEKVADKHEAGTSTDLTPPLTRRPHSAELGSRAGFVAQLLVQARTAHRNAGAYLVQRSSALEADVDASRHALIAALASDREEHRSSAWVFKSIGLCAGGGESPLNARNVHRQGEGEGTEASDIPEIACFDGVLEAMVRADISARLYTLKTKHGARLAKLLKEFLKDATGPSAAGSTEAALDKNGGWTPDQHFRFVKVVKAAKAVGVGGLHVTGSCRSDGTATLMKRMKVELRGVSSTDVSKHESWYRLRGLHVAKTSAEKQRHARELEELVALGKTALEALRKEAKESAARAQERQEQEHRRAELDNLMRKQREVREGREREDQERQKQALLEKLSREAEESKKKAAEDEHKRNAVAEYHESLQELRDREIQAREAAANAAEAERIQRMPKNRERIGFREERSRQKREENERRQREVDALKAKRLQVLEKLAASVPYADACANAEAKLDHITAATAAHFDQFLPFDRSRGHCPMFGYNTGKVFQDARFRLGLYLREAGVSSSRAAHAAVMRSVGPLPDAPF